MVSQSTKTIGIWDKDWCHTRSKQTMCKKYETDVLKIKSMIVAMIFTENCFFCDNICAFHECTWHFAYITEFWMIT